MSSGPLLETVNLVKHFPVRGSFYFPGLAEKRLVRAVDGVSLQVMRGETLAVVGESGCGKTTLARLVMRFTDATAGTIRFDGTDITRLEGKSLKKLRRNMQMVFQDPESSLDPRMRVGEAVAEPLVALTDLGRDEVTGRVEDALRSVGLSPEFLERYPRQLSGGQKQRASIARAIVLHPKLVVLDEPTSALDVSVQAQLLNLLLNLQRDYGLSYMFITHNMAVAQYIADRIAVMYGGKLVELGDARTVISRPRHPYTLTLISSTPRPDPWKRSILRTAVTGEVPSAINPPPGCRFHPRCPYAEDICSQREPLLTEIEPGHLVACHFPEKTVQTYSG